MAKGTESRGELLVFSVTPYQNKNQNCSIDKVQNLGKERWQIYKDSRQDSGHSKMRRNFLPKFVEICIETPRHVGAHLDGHQHGDRKPTETSVTEFCYKSVNFPLVEFKNIKIILFLIHELFI